MNAIPPSPVTQAPSLQLCMSPFYVFTHQVPAADSLLIEHTFCSYMYMEVGQLANLTYIL